MLSPSLSALNISPSCSLYVCGGERTPGYYKPPQASMLRVRRSWQYIFDGDMQTPRQTLVVQALRNTRFVEEIARGRTKLSESSTWNHRTGRPRTGDAARHGFRGCFFR